MSEELKDEIEAINSIYGASTLQESCGEATKYRLTLPEQTITLLLQFPADYPDSAPAVLRVLSVGDDVPKGKAAQVQLQVQNVIDEKFQAGQVCLFDVLEELSLPTDGATEQPLGNSPDQHVVEHEGGRRTQSSTADEQMPTEDPGIPQWVLADTVQEKKSVFVARCAAVSSPAMARSHVASLIESDKKLAKAHHNITAYRIRGEGGVAYQDYDDDGETAAGGRLLHLMQLMDIWNAMVVVTRWYGGVQLGPDRYIYFILCGEDADGE
ncbi:MAG: eIF2 kinase Gcn2p negative regulator [Caeruleum heppii]|nr:MAG: eIF2 kinase Gcn2p negative regulator [Caeruleum heppii]